MAQESCEQQRETDTAFKTKTGSDGQEYDEPKLETKKYRPQERQDLQTFYEPGEIVRLGEDEDLD